MVFVREKLKIFGLKLWSINENYVEQAKKLYDNGVYDYIELYSVPNSYNRFAKIWKSLEIPYIIHAPHFMSGLKLSKREFFENNMILAEEAKRYADLLNAKFIIFHPGIDGDIDESIHQLNKIDDNRILVENKPYYAVKEKLVCNGNSPEEIKHIMENTGVGFCLDIGHAICAANTRKIEPMNYIKDFLKLNPNMYHLTDGQYESEKDRHDHFGKGNYDIKSILGIIPEPATITIETYKDYQDSLDDFKEDIMFLRNCLN
ncbi:MAG: AP endonuclease [uncultured bacterium]|nr:MAG: AP endonuclease [uncultured bacterium]